MRLLLVFLILVSSFSFGQTFERGKELFKQNCAACHNMEKKRVGPPLQGTVGAQGSEWTKEWIKNSQALIKSADGHAVEIWNEYNQAAMPSYSYLPDEDLESLVTYLILVCNSLKSSILNFLNSVCVNITFYLFIYTINIRTIARVSKPPVHYFQGIIVIPIWFKIISTIVKNIPPTTNCHTNHFHPVSDKAHFRIGDFFAKLYKYFFIYLTHFSTQEK